MGLNAREDGRFFFLSCHPQKISHFKIQTRLHSAPMAKRILVCGGRDFSNRAILFKVLDAAHAAHTISAIISGMARGADSLAVEWANAHSVPVAAYPADWAKHGKAAGFIRNQQMLDEGKPDLGFAFPGGRGTADMVRRGRKAGIVILRITPPGTVERIAS